MHQRILSQFQEDWTSHLKVEQMFVLIDGILPFEACLYYQVLPLFLEGNRFNLGMVTPDDSSASDYVRRIVSYLNYSLVTRPISSEALQVVLTAYLNFSGNRQAKELNQREANVSYGHYRHSARSRREQETDQDIRKTLVVDSPDSLDETSILTPPSIDNDNNTMPPPIATPPALAEDDRLEEKELPHPLPEAPLQPSTSPLESPAPEVDDSPPPPSVESFPPAAAQDPGSPMAAPALLKSLPSLPIAATYLTSPVEVLASLPPQEMLQELLARVLVGGIGRLYFESHAQYGRVLWSQNGVPQSVLDRIPLAVFQGLLAELKRMAHLPMLTQPKPKQVEMEYVYDRTRLLLRFRFIPSEGGEDATLQVLRGAALRFHQQQQLAKLERDALGIARQLQSKLNEIRDRAYGEPGLSDARFEMLPAVGQLLHNIEAQLDYLGIHNPENDEGENSAFDQVDQDPQDPLP